MDPCLTSLYKSKNPLIKIEHNFMYVFFCRFIQFIEANNFELLTIYQNHRCLYSYMSGFFFRTKWKRQTAVGLELLTEATNFATVQRMIHSNNYWTTFHPNITSLVNNIEQSVVRPRCPIPTSSQYLSSLFMSGALPSLMSQTRPQEDR